jgi:4a-hydroxytetrahydrobiopterin dehydratase
MELSQKKCQPCEGNVPALKEAEIKKLLQEVSSWEIRSGHVFKQFKFRDFKEAISFVNKVADIAEQEGHHPDITVNYNKVGIELWTHAINGLSENDFILAAKIDKVKI